MRRKLMKVRGDRNTRWAEKGRSLLLCILSVMLVLAQTALADTGTDMPACLIDASRTGSLTIFKYDMTKAAEDDRKPAGTIPATGAKQAAVETEYAGYEVEGVGFRYLKVGNIRTYQKNGVIQVYYGVDDELAALLSLDDGTVIEGETCYASESVITALRTVMGLSADLSTVPEPAEEADADEITAKNLLEELLEEEGTLMDLTDSSGSTTAEDLPLGLYLVAETLVPEQISRTTVPFLVSLPMTDVTGTEWNYDVTVYPKNESDQPTLQKEVTEITTAEEENWSDTATASAGDIVAYQITSDLPVITSAASYLTVYTFEDHLSAGLTYRDYETTEDEDDTVTITWYASAEGGDAMTVWSETDNTPCFTVERSTAEDGGSVMSVRMTAAGLAEINGSSDISGTAAYSGCRMVISYRADLNSDESLILGDDGNPNTVQLTWKRTSSDYYDTLEDDCRVYTYGLDVTKMFDAVTETMDYRKVSFLLYNSTDGYYVQASSAKDGVYYAEAAEPGNTAEDGTALIPDQAGKLTISGLEDDVYEITELTTSPGYKLLKDVIRVELTAETGSADTPDTGNDLHHAEDGAGHHKVSGSAKVNGETAVMAQDGDSLNARACFTVVNTKGFDIPRTGESGAFLLPLAGVMGAGVLILLGLHLRRDENEAEH